LRHDEAIVFLGTEPLNNASRHLSGTPRLNARERMRLWRLPFEVAASQHRFVPLHAWCDARLDGAAVQSQDDSAPIRCGVYPHARKRFLRIGPEELAANRADCLVDCLVALHL
jgi:hypothetical protein